ncbi:MAG: peptide ABC transporter substrate-binding protein [Chloroflexia bacterium]
MKSSKYRLSVLALLTSFSMVLASCGGETATVNPTATTGSGSTTDATATTGTGSSATDPTATTATGSGGATGAIPGVLRVNWVAQPENLDLQQFSFVGEIGFAELIFEGLLKLDKDLNPVPAAAESCTASADGLKYTCIVRTGLKYSDGQPLTAKNFEYSWKRLFDPRVPNKQYSFVAYDIAGAEELDSTPVTDTAKIDELMGSLGVKATSDTQIEFTLKQKAAYFPYILTLWTGWPGRQDLIEAGGEDWTTDSTGKYYVGNGPFILKEYSETGFRMESNPNYREGKPKLNEIRGVYINDSAVSFQAYKKGELDIVSVAAEDLATIQGDTELKKDYIEVAGSCNFYLGFNTKKPPFDNVKVRQAFAQAFDRKDYVDSVLKGLGDVALSFVPPDRPGHDADLKLYDFNAEAAKKTLADANVNLPEIKLTYSSSPRNKTRMEWIQNQVKKNLGIDLVLDPVEPKSYTGLVKDPATTPQVFFLGWCQDYPDPQNWLTLVFHSESTVTHVGWKNDEFDTLTRQADAEPDQAKRLEMYSKAQEILVREAPAVFLVWDKNPYLVKPYIKGMKENIIPQDKVVPGIANIVNIEVGP